MRKAERFDLAEVAFFLTCCFQVSCRAFDFGLRQRQIALLEKLDRPTFDAFARRVADAPRLTFSVYPHAFTEDYHAAAADPAVPRDAPRERWRGGGTR